MILVIIKTQLLKKLLTPVLTINSFLTNKKGEEINLPLKYSLTYSCYSRPHV